MSAGEPTPAWADTPPSSIDTPPEQDATAVRAEDRELLAIQRLLEHLEGLSDEGVMRVLVYVLNRKGWQARVKATPPKREPL